MQPSIEATRLKAWRLFLRAHSEVIRVLEDELEEERGLALSAYEVLMRLYGSERPWRMHELADSLFLSRSGATRLVEKLEKNGLVTRTICEDDRRGIQVAVTTKGKRTLRAAAPVHVQGVQKHFTQHLSETEAAVLCSAFAKIIDATEGFDRPTVDLDRADAER